MPMCLEDYMNILRAGYQCSGGAKSVGISVKLSVA